MTEKTVEDHLARAYDTLGVRSRTGLPAALGTGAAPELSAARAGP